jgi:uncharacterized protein YjiS (DUF1127 family)
LDKSIEIRHSRLITDSDRHPEPGGKVRKGMVFSASKEDFAMTDHAFAPATSIHGSGAISAFSNLLRNWRARRAVGRLDDFDDYMLSDIGVTRDEVRWALSLPLTTNAAQALHETARSRRAGARR